MKENMKLRLQGWWRRLLRLFHRGYVIRDIVVFPAPVLKEYCRPVLKIDGQAKAVVAALQKHLGARYKLDKSTVSILGLAAPQLGINLRIFCVKYRGLDWVAINPQIVREVGTQITAECCESLPGKEYEVRRPKLIKIRALGLDGQLHLLKGHDLTAAVLKHEYDHLNGVMINSIGRRLL